MEGKGDPKEIQARINGIKQQIIDCTSDYDKEKAAGASGEAVRRRSGNCVGAANETEMKEMKLRIEDALGGDTRGC